MKESPLPAEFVGSNRFEKIAKKIISKHESVSHVEIDNVLFVEEINTSPKALAACFKLSSHPIKVFTEKNFCIVVYNQNTDYMNENQLAILMLHELKHIPAFGDKLNDHNVKDFKSIISDYGVDWAENGVKPKDILKEAKSDG